jgi:hypothetical protein
MTIKEKIAEIEAKTVTLTSELTVVGSAVDASSGALMFKSKITDANGKLPFDIGMLDLEHTDDYSVSLTTASEFATAVNLRVIKNSATKFTVKAIDLEYFAEDQIAYDAIKKGELSVEGVITFTKEKVQKVQGA